MRFLFLGRGNATLILVVSSLLLLPCTGFAQGERFKPYSNEAVSPDADNVQADGKTLNDRKTSADREALDDKEKSINGEALVDKEAIVDKETAPAGNQTEPAGTPEGSSGGEVLEEGAEETPPDYEYTEPEFAETRASYPMLIVRTLAVLAVIVIAIWLIFRFLLRRRNKLVTDTELIKVLATFPLAANRLIKVIDVAGKVLILGVTDSNINLITEVEDKELVDRIKLVSSQEASGRGSFKDQFFKLIGGRAFTRTGDAGYLRGYKDRINRMKKL